MTTRYPYDALRTFTGRVFEACGVPPEPAGRAAEALCYADLHGFHTHGLHNLEPIYVQRLEDGRVDPLAEPEVVRDSGACVLLDGADGLGLYVGGLAMDLAVDRAAGLGIGAVAVRRSSHFGSAGFYAMQAQRRGMIGVAMTNLGRQGIAPPPGGTVRMLGTNPLSVAVPTGRRPALLLDMSTTVVATGRLREAQRRGEPVPDGWLVDRAGRTVDDPSTYDRGEADLLWLGSRIETGAAKGFGLGLVVETLCGVLSGAGVGPRPALLRGEASDSDLDIGHFFLALDVGAFRDPRAFSAQMDDVLGAVLDCPPRDDRSPVSYPGHREARTRECYQHDGVPVESDLEQRLLALAERLEVPAPASLVRTPPEGP